MITMTLNTLMMKNNHLVLNNITSNIRNSKELINKKKINQ
jgi:hypothetical protein